ncbi:MAG: tetratricopeptide repeat protein [Gemmatimonadales bacterium]
MAFTTIDGNTETVPAHRSGPASAWHGRDALVVVLVAALVYANALANRFALDDNDVVLNNPLVHHFAGTWQAFAHSYWPEATGAGQYRPLTMATFALDWVISGGNAAWLHAANVLWHVAACLLVWRVLSDLTSRSGALAGALIFAVHPVHVEAVSNLVGRSDVISAAFTLAALLAHRRRHWIAVPCYAAALFAKESGVTFIGLAVASDLLLPGPLAVWESQPQRWSLRTSVPVNVVARWPLYAGYAAVTAAYAAILARLFRDMPLVRVAEPWMHASTVERLLTVARIVPEYARLLLVPLQLHVDYMPRSIEVVHQPALGVVVGLAIVIAAVIVTIRAWKRAPVVAFAVLAFACTIAPVANVFFASGVMVAERTLYLPSIGLAILVAWSWDVFADRRRALAGAIKRVSDGAALGLFSGGASPHRLSDGSTLSAARPPAETMRALPHGRLQTSILLLALVVLAVRTWTRTPVWRNDKTMLVASLAGEPESYRVHERAAEVIYRIGNLDGALHEYAIARTLYPVAPLLYQAPAALLAAHGRDAEASGLLDSARLVDPSPYEDAMRRAWVRYAARDYQGTITWARSAYVMQRDSVDALMVLTQAAQQIDDVRDAVIAFRLGLSDHPRNRALHRSYAAMLASTGDTIGANREASLAKGR